MGRKAKNLSDNFSDIVRDILQVQVAEENYYPFYYIFCYRVDSKLMQSHNERGVYVVRLDNNDANPRQACVFWYHVSNYNQYHNFEFVGNLLWSVDYLPNYLATFDFHRPVCLILERESNP